MASHIYVIFNGMGTHVATQWAAVTIHRLVNKAPPHANFLERKPDLIIAAYYTINEHRNVK